MKKTWMISTVAVLLVMGLSIFQTGASAQPGQREGRQRMGEGRQFGPGPGGFNMEGLRERMMDRVKEQLGSSDEEWTAIEPMIAQVTEKRMGASRYGVAGAMMGAFRRAGAAPGGGSQMEQPAEVAALSRVLENPDASSDDIKAALDSLRKAREAAQDELNKAQDELRGVLTVRQEAQLILLGMLD